MATVEVLSSLQVHGTTLALRRRGDTYDVILGSVVLLSSAALETERAFGELPRDLGIASPSRVLVGGLGFGATALGALSIVGDGGKVIVVEKLQPIVDFLKGPVAHLAPGLFDDPRLELVVDDVYDVIAKERDLDAILLDVDNGPGWASFRSNARIYSDAGLSLCGNALRDGGALAVWSGYPADGFVGTIRASGLIASTVPLEERGIVRARAYVGRKRAAESP